MRARDTQRSKVYSWEVAWRDARELTMAECAALVQRVFADYGERPPLVTDGRGRSSGCYWPGRHEIALPKQLRRTYAVLHECAHGLLRHSAQAWHGPKFARLLINLMARYGGVSASEMRKRATACHVKVAALDMVPQPLSSKQAAANKHAREESGKREFRVRMRAAMEGLDDALDALVAFDTRKTPYNELIALRTQVAAFSMRYPASTTRDAVAASAKEPVTHGPREQLPRMV